MGWSHVSHVSNMPQPPESAYRALPLGVYPDAESPTPSASLRRRRTLFRGMAEGEDAGTVIGDFLDRAAQRGSQPLWYHQSDGRWLPISWESAQSKVVSLAAGLAAIGIAPGERVGLMGPNRPEWVIADYAIQHVGGVVVPIYATSPPDQIAHILTTTGARVCIAYGDEPLGKIREADIQGLETVVALHWSAEEQGQFLGSDALQRRGEDWVKENPGGLAERLAGIDPEQLATVIFTSGTGDEPKGVRLSHRNLMWAANSSARAVGFRAKEKTLSYLPLAHAFERVVTTVLPLVPATQRWTCWFVEELEDLPAALRSVRPTLFIAVPAVWARMHNRIKTEMQSLRIGRRLLAQIARVAGEMSSRHREQGWAVLPSTPMAGISARLLGRRVLKKVGLERCWFAVSGAAPLPGTTQAFFQGLGLPLQQGWGLTETAALCTVQRRNDLELGVVGEPLEGVELRLGEHDEVLVRGPNVFMGYEAEPGPEAAVFDEEGFLHTGDVGQLTEDGRLVIIDRLNDVIITAGGRSIAPRPIESRLTSDPLISGTMVVGEGRPYLTALISLNGPEASSLVSDERHLEQGLWEHPTVHQHVERAVGVVNRSLSGPEQIHGFAILPFGFPDEALTSSMKLKRRVVEATFSELIESLYA